MSTESQTTKKPSNKDHGTTQSYVVGFILSLIFTIIPYHLVVNKVLTGNSLLVAILGIAVLQMFIQIFFFLHLGRGPKPFYNIVFFFGTAGLIVIVVGASLFIMDNLYRTMLPEEFVIRQAQEENISQISGEKTGACTGNKDNHIVTINDGVANPVFTRAKLCDTLTLTIEDGKDREIVFGLHPEHESYGGMYEVPVSARKSEIITLNQAGDFVFHDHLVPGLIGQFSVEP